MIKLEDIKKKYAFMYEIDGVVYHIGQGVFEKCRSRIAKQYFDEYRSIIKRIGRENILPYHLEDNEIESLVYFFRKVKAYSNVIESEKIPEVQKQISTFLDSLSVNEKNELFEQLEDYVRVFWYYNRRS